MNSKNKQSFRIDQIYYKICIFSVILITMSNCVIFSRSARSAEKAEKVKANYQIGYLENRDFRFDPFRVKNFVSLLKFEIIKGGNGIIEEGSEVESAKSGSPAPAALTALTQNPEAKETPALPPLPTPNPEMPKSGPETVAKEGKRILTEIEIKNLSAKMNFDYYLQGSFGMSDNGSILDRNFATLIFIDVYDKSGKLVRTVSYSQESKNFSEAEDLKHASISLVDKIMQRGDKSESKEWWKFGF